MSEAQKLAIALRELRRIAENRNGWSAASLQRMAQEALDALEPR